MNLYCTLCAHSLWNAKLKQKWAASNVRDSIQRIHQMVISNDRQYSLNDIQLHWQWQLLNVNYTVWQEKQREREGSKRWCASTTFKCIQNTTFPIFRWVNGSFFLSMCCIHMVYGKAINVWEYGTDVTHIRDRQHQYKSIFDWCCWLSHRNLTSRKKREKDEHEHRKVGSPFIQLYTFFAYIVNWMWTLCVCELNK